MKQSKKLRDFLSKPEVKKLHKEAKDFVDGIQDDMARRRYEERFRGLFNY